MIPALMLAASLLTPVNEPDPASMRSSSALTLRLALARADGAWKNPEQALSMMIEGGHGAVEELGSSAFAETLEEAIEGARWRALADNGRALERLAVDYQRALADLEFEPAIEADLPRGFPAPTAVREIELKSYPIYRMVRTEMKGGGPNGAFWKLFSHIRQHDIPMTAPVEMTYRSDGDVLSETRMAFLYGEPELGSTGAEKGVEVVDAEAAWVASIGCRGRTSQEAIESARERLVQWIEGQVGLESYGDLRVMGYNSPMVPNSRRYFEVQIPVRANEIPEPARVVIDFGNSNEPERWNVVNDSVMGGLSRSSLRSTAEGTCVFSGEVSLRNNGGFASVRTRTMDFDLEGAESITLAFHGDGNSYKLRLRTNNRHDGVNYELPFQTVDGLWMEHTFQLEDFVPVWRGRRVRDAGSLDASRVRSVGLMISDKQEGSFRLEVAALTSNQG